MNLLKAVAWSLLVILCGASLAHAGEADLAIPNLYKHGSFHIFGQEVTAGNLLFYGSFVIAATLGISLYLAWQIASKRRSRGAGAVYGFTLQL